MLEARALAFGYRGFPVGLDASFTLSAGEVVCLLGPNGCGKTTLFKTVLGLIPRQGGKVLIDGDAIEALPRQEVARRLAYVPQAHPAVFPYSVGEIVLMGRTAHRGMFASPTAEDRRRARRALDELGIEELAVRDYTRLSGGQRQLVLIARALAQESPYIVLDEPTASLDYGNQVRLLERVRSLAGAGRGLIMSTHNPDHAFALASRVLAMRDGLIVADGAPADILDAARLAEIYGVAVDVVTLADGRRITVPAA
ncbi:MAG: ABC transporter ATP-binding protein [Flavobacteriaceae bacterium]